MKIISDLHLHSKYSRAVSQQMILPEMARWANKKGINLLGTGDFTHPLWFRELKSQLEESTDGIYKLKGAKPEDPLFLLSTEISSIYSQGGKVRRIHNVVLAPSLETVERINAELLRRGANLMSDGRPIIGLSARDLAELVLTVDENALFIPAHVWTPWFSLYGSESGFDSINECFGNMAKNIYAVETGLSSNPAMNWRISELDSRQIISFSDAHSGAKLGREATVFAPKADDLALEGFNFIDIREALKGGISGRLKIAYTIEFYPEEGKYHYTGHRNCKVRQSPEETKERGSLCPVCQKGLTVGVMHRVDKLAGREHKEDSKEDRFGTRWLRSTNGPRPPYVMLVPLLEILAEALDSTPTSQRVLNEYDKLTDNFGSELKALLTSLPDEITRICGEKVAEGILKVRKGRILVEPGYDGEYGVVKIWTQEAEKIEPEVKKDQLSLF